MADQMKSSIFTGVEWLIWGLKLMLLFVGFMSTVYLLKVAVIPYSSDLILSTLPTLWISLRLWLSPPFLFIIVNFIVFAILVSSFSDGEIAIADDLITVTEGKEREEEKQMVCNFSASSEEKVIDPPPEASQEDHPFPDYDETESGEELVVHDGSLESTWKAILKEQVRHERHLRTSQTVRISSFDLGSAKAYAVYGGNDDNRVAWNKREMKKSDTFHNRVSYLRESPMSQDELKRRSEAFIDKINAEMRLQRLESAHRFLVRHC